jgi:hypothetical protein
VGFWGSLVMAQPTTSLGEHPLIAALGGDLDLSTGIPDGWQGVMIHAADFDATSLLLARLVEATARPAMIAIVADSDFAQITALAPDGSSWEAVINPESAADYGVIVDSVSLADSPGEAERWAGAAGVTVPDPAGVGRALNSEHTFAEDGVIELAKALGVWL